MRGSIKLKVLLIGFFSFLFALLANRNSEGAVYAFEICTLRTYTIECIDGTNNFSTTQYYWDCVTYFGYIYMMAKAQGAVVVETVMVAEMQMTPAVVVGLYILIWIKIMIKY